MDKEDTKFFTSNNISFHTALTKLIMTGRKSRTISYFVSRSIACQHISHKRKDLTPYDGKTICCFCTLKAEHMTWASWLKGKNRKFVDANETVKVKRRSGSIDCQNASVHTHYSGPINVIWKYRNYFIAGEKMNTRTYATIPRSRRKFIAPIRLICLFLGVSLDPRSSGASSIRNGFSV